MDPFDLIPIVPPNLPGESSPQLTDSQRFVFGVSSTLLPTLSFLLVLFAGFAAHPAVALAVLPLTGAAASLLIARLLSVSRPWGLVIALGALAFCLIGDTIALFLHELAQFFHDF
jgi:hypothetical protein